MRLTILVVLAAAAAGCSPVTPWPSFYPAEYAEEQVRDVPPRSVAMACRSCPSDGPTSKVCVAVHPLEKPIFCDGRTPDGRRGVLVPVQMEHRVVGAEKAFLSIRDAEIVVRGERIPSSIYYSDFGYEDWALPGQSRTLTVGFVVAEAVIAAADSFVIACPCPGRSDESLEFEFVAQRSDAAR